MKKLLLRTLLICLPFIAIGQSKRVATYPTLFNNNGSSGVAFNLTTGSAPILVKDIFNAANNGATHEILWSPNPINNPATGWAVNASYTSLGTWPTVGGNGTVPVSISGGTLNWIIPANTTVAVVIDGGMSYFNTGTTWPAGVPTSFSSPGNELTITTGPGVGYGGGKNAMSFSPRGFVGWVDFEIFGFPNDAGVSDVYNPGIPTCATLSDTVEFEIQNFGLTGLDSCLFNWSFNGAVQSPIKFIGPLTNRNSFSSVVVNAPRVLIEGDTIKAWTSMPNGVMDSLTSNDTIEFIIRKGILSGLYTVGGPFADYDSLHKAIDDINFKGICGDITFRLNNGNHYALCDIGDVDGMDNGEKITFTSLGQNPDSSTIIWNATNASENRVIGFYGSQNFYFEHLTIADSSGATYSGLIELENASNINFFNCNFNTTYAGTSNRSRLVYNSGSIDGLSFKNCAFNNGYEAFFIEGNSKGIEIEFCEFNNFYRGAIALSEVENVLIDNNENFNSTRSPQTSSAFLRLNEVAGSLYITNNSNIRTETTMRNGFIVNEASGSPSNPILIANNRIVMGDTNLTGQYRGLSFNDIKFTSIAHNSIVVLGTNANSTPIYTNLGNSNDIVNNVFVNYGSGLCFDVVNKSFINDMNNNVIFNSSRTLGEYTNGGVTSFNDWNTNFGFDVNGASADPMFLDSTLVFCSSAIDNIGTPTVISSDVTGVNRSTTNPDPGAFEFSTPDKFSAGDVFSICNGDVVTITPDVSASDIIIWDGIDTSKTKGYSQTGMYQATLVGVCGTSTDTFHVVINDVVQLPNDTNICAGDTFNIITNLPTANHSWNTGSGSSSIDIHRQGQYYVGVNDSDNCFSSDTIEITFSRGVDLANDTTLCKTANSSIDLNPGTGVGSYLWSNGSSANRQIVDSSSTYWVRYTDNSNCVSTDTMMVNFVPLPFATFTQSQFSQSNWEFIADDQSGDDYLWSFGDGNIDSGKIWKTVNIYQSNGIYKVELTVKSNLCGETKFSKEIEVITVGNEEFISNNSFTVYPNPVSSNGIIVIDYKSIGSAYQVKLISLDGATVLERVVNQNATSSINVSNLDISTGVYIIEVEDQNKIQRTKIQIH